MKIKLTAFTLFFILILASAAADELEPAILVKGPVRHQGIEYLGANAIPAYYGEYGYQGDKVRIYFTEEEVFLSEDWSVSECRIPGMLVRIGDDGRINAVYQDRKNWTAFLSFDPESDYICSFVNSYRARQNYFLNIARDKTSFSFPAILDFSRE